MTHKLDADDLFIHRVQQHCAELGLNFFLVEPLWVEPFCDQFAKGKIWARALLNMHSEHHLPDDVYHRLIWLAHERKTQIIDPPDVAIGTFDKAKLHVRLLAAGFNVPFTVIVPRAANGEPVYFRVFYVFGSVWCCWWNCFTDRYRLPTQAEEEQLALTPLRDIVGRVAERTGMKFFSSEVALTESGEFVLIDYVNDQCHMLSQGANPQMGVPNELVSAIARRLVEGVSQMIKR